MQGDKILPANSSVATKNQHTAFYSARDTGPEAFAKAAVAAVKNGYTAMKFDLDEANDPNLRIANWTAQFTS